MTDRDTERTRAQLRRLVQNGVRSAQKCEEYRTELCRAANGYGSALAMLRLTEGPLSAELFRAALAPAGLKTCRKERYGIRCLQVDTGTVSETDAASGLLAPQNDAVMTETRHMVAVLTDYINETLACRALSASAAQLRRSLHALTRKGVAERAVILARRTALERASDHERRRHLRDGNQR